MEESNERKKTFPKNMMISNMNKTAEVQNDKIILFHTFESIKQCIILHEFRLIELVLAI
jgi:hypothetical protein